ASGGRSKVRRARMKNRQRSPFAAVLEKTLNADALAKKAGAKSAGLAGKAQKAELAEKRSLSAGNKKSVKPWEDVPGFSAEHAAEKRTENLAWAAMIPGDEKRSPAAEVFPMRSVFAKTTGIPAQETGKDALRPAMEAPGKTGEGKPAGEKSRPAAEKKVSAKQEAEAPRRKENREEAKKAEKQDSIVLPREVKASSPEDVKQDARQEIEIRVITRAGDERFDDTLRTADERSVRESASGLLRRMREDGNSDIVRSARIILKDHNEGEIRLILKPASLGEVRMRLSVQDNLIGGRIFVENESVRSVFEQNMPDLVSAFRENGLQLGELAVSVGNGERREGGEGGESGFYAAEKKVEPEQETRPAAGAAAYYFVSHRVNVMA
ncbi:MAG: flagellar hook-length control protein FliK, partial [Spirochaetaceae bacterium]|nr:flagellar hook-length control protein FliK [Spirochaetaceae bacterium]